MRTTTITASAAAAAAAASKTLRSAEWWDEQSEATLLDVVNVLGRWQNSAEWKTRTRFAVPGSIREESMTQAASIDRYDYAVRNKLVERVALVQNVPNLPFRNAELAAAYGKTLDEMNALPVRPSAANIVFDALAQSKSSLLPEAVVDDRVQSFFNDDGTLNEGAIGAGMAKSRLAVTSGFILLGKGQLYGLAAIVRVVLDATGGFDELQRVLGPYAEAIYWVLSLSVAAYAVQQSMEVTRRTGDYELMSREDAEAAFDALDEKDKRATVLGPDFFKGGPKKD